VFVMNRKDGVLQFPELTSGPRLEQITLAFAGGQAAGVRASLTVQASQSPGVVSLAIGEIRLIAAPERSS
jgi:hypothetical protein